MPQLLGLELGAAGTITSITLTKTNGEILCSIGEDTFKAVAQSERFEALVDTDVLWIPVQTGESNESGTISVVTGAGGTVNVYGFSMQQGNISILTQEDTVLANQTKTLNKFSKMGVLSMGASDVINITFSDGTTQLCSAAELASLCSMQFENSGGLIVLDNTDQQFRSVQFKPSANRTIWLQRVSEGSMMKAAQEGRGGRKYEKVPVRGNANRKY